MRTLWRSGIALLSALLLTGCFSVEYFQDRAVERAREYLVAHAPELTAAELYFLKYHKPVFLVSDVVGGVAVGGKTSLTTELQQICITWKFPDRKEYYMVYGVSSRTMEWWFPDRLIKRTFDKPEPKPLTGAVESCRSYALNNLWEIMTPKTHNRIRFREPWVLKTDFNLNFDPDSKLTPEELEKAREDAAKKTQFSLVWKPEEGDWVVFSGVGGEDFSGWSILMAGFMKPEDVGKHTLEVVAIPGEDGKSHQVTTPGEELVNDGVIPASVLKEVAAPAK